MASVGPAYSSSWYSASATPYDDDDWLNIGYLTSGSTLATITSSTYDNGDYSYVAHSNGHFGAIPAGTIDGIVVHIRGRYDLGGASIAYVQLQEGGSPIGTAKTTEQAITASNATYTFGSSTDTWGASLTPAIVNSVTFGLRFSVKATVNNTDISFDYGAITCYYTASGGGTVWVPPSSPLGISGFHGV